MDVQLSHKSFLIALINLEDLINEIFRSYEMIKSDTWLLINACETTLVETERHIIKNGHFQILLYLLVLLGGEFSVFLLLEVETT